MTTIFPICFNCKYYIGYENGLYKCEAFENIPDIILFGEDNHSKPLKDQKNNIVFEKK